MKKSSVAEERRLQSQRQELIAVLSAISTVAKRLSVNLAKLDARSELRKEARHET
jgi:hypothetical protein